MVLYMNFHNIVGDNMSYVLGNADEMKSKLEEYSERLGISVGELIDRYVRMELYMDDFFEKHPSRVLEEKRRKDLEEFKREAKKRGPKEVSPEILAQREKLRKWKLKEEDNRRRFLMYANYEIQNEKLKRLVEAKAKKLNKSVDELVWAYVNRGLMNDGFDEDRLEERHSSGFLEEINEIMGL